MKNKRMLARTGAVGCSLALVAGYIMVQSAGAPVMHGSESGRVAPSHPPPDTQPQAGAQPREAPHAGAQTRPLPGSKFGRILIPQGTTDPVVFPGSKSFPVFEEATAPAAAEPVIFSPETRPAGEAGDGPPKP